MLDQIYSAARKRFSKRRSFETLFLLLVFLITYSGSFGQKFAPFEDDVMDFIPEVSYDLFLKKQLLQTGLTSKDTITILDTGVVFDSIHFRKAGFRSKGFLKDSLSDVVFLQKEVFELDEVVIETVAKKEVFLGEKSRFVKKRSNPFETEPTAGIVFFREEFEDIDVSRLSFFVEKVQYKTQYKIKFFECDIQGSIFTNQTFKLRDLFFETPILTIDRSTKNEVSIDLKQLDFPKPKTNVFVVVELVSYEDEKGLALEPEPNKQTKLKYQLSKKMNYFAQMFNRTTNALTPFHINVNAMIRRDFNSMFKETPHRSILVAPAIALYGVPVQ